MARSLTQIRSLYRSNDFFSRYPPALIVIYVVTGYICIVSLYTFILGIVFRFEQERFFFPGDTADPFYELGTSFGFWGTLYFCINFILATRWRWVETLFGGLDRVYQTHQLVGKLTLTFVVLHGVILILQALPDTLLLSTYLVPGLDISYTFGVIGLLLLTMLVIVTIWLKLPYQLWLQSHKFMGLAYVLGGLHAIILRSTGT